MIVGCKVTIGVWSVLLSLKGCVGIKIVTRRRSSLLAFSHFPFRDLQNATEGTATRGTSWAPLKGLAVQVSINKVGRKNYQPRGTSRAVRGATNSSLLVFGRTTRVAWQYFTEWPTNILLIRGSENSSICVSECLTKALTSINANENLHIIMF